MISQCDNNGNQLLATKTVSVEPLPESQEIYDEFIMGDLENSVIEYQYNSLNQLTKAIVDNDVIDYTYNIDGLRATKTANGQTTKHIWNGNHIVLELDGNDNTIATYTRGINLIAAKDNQNNKQYYLYNAHGDVVHLTDENGNITKNYDYDAFGNELNEDENDTNPFRYCGEYYDKETGTIYLRARYYNPVIGRFISQDSYLGDSRDPLSLNLYTYCSNNPIIYVDPSGHHPIYYMIMEWLSAIATSPDINWDIQFIGDDLARGDYVSAALDGVGACIPGISGVGSGTRGAWKSFKSLFGNSDDMIRTTKSFFGNGKVSMPYKVLKKIVKGTGLEVHHLLEKRFLKNPALKKISVKANEIMSVAIDKEFHKKITKRMRELIPYDSIWKNNDEITTSTASLQEIWDATE